MRTVYVDTGAWIALTYRRDRAHSSASQHFLGLRDSGDLLVTSDPALGETVTRLRYDAGLSAALAFRKIVDEAVRLRLLRVHESDAELRARAFSIMAKFADLRLSYADCVGAAVADRVQARAVFGFDHDFRIMGHTLEP